MEYFGDPAGSQAQGQSGLGDIEIFRRKGIVVNTKRDKVSRSIASGVSHVQRNLPYHLLSRRAKLAKYNNERDNHSATLDEGGEYD